jgi:hypothetical protein
MEYQPLIRLPNVGDIEFNPYYAQQAIMNDRSRFRVVNKPRQAGITTANAAGESVFKVINGNNPEILVLSKSEKETIGFMEKFYLSFHSVKDKDPNCPKIVKENTKYARFDNGAVVRALTSGKTSGRSYSGTDVYFDEMAFATYAQEIFTGTFPALSRTGGNFTVFCTPNGKGNLFHTLCKNAAEMGFSYHQYEWWFVPEYNEYYEEFMQCYLSGDRRALATIIAKARKTKWYQHTLAAMGEFGMAQEYECNFDANSDMVFSGVQLDKLFSKNWLVEKDEEYGEVYRDETGEKYNDYYTFIDYGRKRDPTVCITLGWSDHSNRWRLVEYKRITPMEFAWTPVLDSIKETYHRYDPEMYHDGTGNGDALTAELSGISVPITITNIHTSKLKDNAIMNMQRACDNEAVELPRIPQLVKEFENYRWNDKKIVQDCVMAVVMAVFKCYDASEAYVGLDRSFQFV